jgi:hypothetical protein
VEGLGVLLSNAPQSAHEDHGQPEQEWHVSLGLLFRAAITLGTEVALRQVFVIVLRVQ